MSDDDGPKFPLLRLSGELQMKIIWSATSPRQVTLSNWLAIDPDEEKTLLPLLLSCRHIYEMIVHDPLFRSPFKDPRVNRHLLMNVNNDTLRVNGMNIPDDGHGGAVPVRSLFSVNHTWLLRQDGRVLRAPSAELDDVPGHELTFDKTPPDRWFPNLEDFTLSIISTYLTSRYWRIDGFQVNEGAQYLSQIGAVADTGIRWNFVEGATRVYFDDIFDFGTLIGEEYGQGDCISPYIGLHGYSDGRRSHGGDWAGFRPAVVTGLLQFSPLNWSDVKDAIVNKHNRDFLEMPLFSSRVWIIRGADNPPDDDEHSWIEVREPIEGDPRYIGQIADTWKMLRHQFDCVTPTVYESHPSRIKDWDPLDATIMIGII
ncbi:hypothetical protein B0T10DRAFT_564804 [Thelonectria olida]|uniref:Uncharacterized protein n=1 Tax=Thelonectria olida TaxID=1576542 RepID=A0A9P9AIN7_9HYPO|nr:hypothetical protein B0T10DRAFT_564804 [Thelonectria olida]